MNYVARVVAGGVSQALRKNILFDKKDIHFWWVLRIDNFLQPVKRPINGLLVEMVICRR